MVWPDIRPSYLTVLRYLVYLISIDGGDERWQCVRPTDGRLRLMSDRNGVNSAIFEKYC